MAFDLFGNESQQENSTRKKKTLKENPMLALYGISNGRVCKMCIHFYTKKMGNKYFKCSLRKCTNGPATDHRANWQACGKFEFKP